MRLKHKASISLISKIIIKQSCAHKYFGKTLMTLNVNIKAEHPGGVILDWIIPDGMTITEAARRLGVSRQSLDALINERRSVTPEMAKRLELAFGGTAQTLLAIQMRYDLTKVEERVSEFAEEVEPYDAG